MNTQHVPRPHTAAGPHPARGAMRAVGTVLARCLTGSSPMIRRLADAPPPSVFPCDRPTVRKGTCQHKAPVTRAPVREDRDERT